MSRWVQLIEHAEEQTERASHAMAGLQQQIDAAEAQRDQMQSYRQEYAQRAATPGTVGSIRQLIVIRQFGDQVEKTVSELDSQLQALRDRYAALRDKWSESYKREQALRALQRIDDQKRAVKEERVRRREEDDFSLQIKRRRDAG